MSKERFTIEHFGEFDDVESFIYDNKCQRRILKSYNYGYNDLMEMIDFINQQDHKIAVLERALRKRLEEEWIGCPDYVVDDMFKHWLEIAESDIKKEQLNNHS